MPPNDVISLAEKFRAQLIAQDAVQLARVSDAYRLIYNRLKDKIDLLVAEVGELGVVTRGQVVRLARYKSLITSIETEMAQFSGFINVELSTTANQLIGQASAHVQVYMRVSGLTGQFATIPPETIHTLLGFLDPSGPLYERLGKLAATNAAAVSEAIIEGVGLGYSPIKLAKIINTQLGVGLTDALRMTRTVQLWTYRESTRANYAANADVVFGWIWFAELTGACMSCVNQHGSIHRLDETLDDHHNGRCAMLPFTGDNPIEQSGADWFAEQPKAYQVQQMGPAKYDAWNSGKVSISDMSKTVHNDVFGDMRVETPLKDLIPVVQ